MYKTSFNGLSVSVKGVYSAYNLSQNEYESLKRAVGADNINGSNGNYTVFQNAKRQVLLKLYIHDFWTPVAFDIRSDLLKLYKSNRIYEEKIMDLSSCRVQSQNSKMGNHRLSWIFKNPGRIDF